MKWLVKILAVVLVLCILLTLFVACKKKGTQTDENGEENGEQGGTQKQAGDLTSSIDDNEELTGEDHNINDDTVNAGQFN